MRNSFETGSCWGAFEVLLRVGYLMNPDRTTLLHICPPAGVTQTQFVKIFLAYASQHREQLHQEFTHFAIDSLRKAFPCK